MDINTRNQQLVAMEKELKKIKKDLEAFKIPEYQKNNRARQKYLMVRCTEIEDEIKEFRQKLFDNEMDKIEVPF